ncbi:S8 family serine peptidase [Flammeovirga aprica]|uniref:S8 family serine peptidase n=1 Tax=Flammeovirga aprica JL-4 TaxID=694437 RepID=A0A7X9RY96_9BACT|nr:S8 family serine peptidase [Flammeovirga aprica]NME70894.1 S8 family serine peptidase [Flammeovirga aprica JL-4]
MSNLWRFVRSKYNLILLINLILTSSLYSQTSQETKKGTIRVKIKSNEIDFFNHQLQKIDNKQLSIYSTGYQKFDRLNDKFHTTKIRRVFRNAGKFEERHKSYGFHQWYEIETDSLNEFGELLTSYSELDIIEFAEPKTVYKVFGDTSKEPPNDPFFDLQWHYHNTGQNYGTEGADISLLDAWKIETGLPDVVVGVIDGGIDTEHPDLKNRLWINVGEIPGNGIDDDGNGYVDDYYGWNYADNMPTIIPDSHGTHVAGTIGAENNNGKGVSGIAGGSDSENGIRMMSLQVFSHHMGTPTAGGFEEAFVYAADMGAVITNNSWGGGVESELQKETIRYFVENAGKDENGQQVGPVDGGVAVFAAGNFGSLSNIYTSPAFSFPAVMDEVISVANTDNTDKKALSSYFHETVDIAAPGTEIYSTLPGGKYGLMSGTSMAAPHVTGVAALIASSNAYSISADQIKDRLINYSTNIDHINASIIGYIGKGRLNAYSSLLKDIAAKPQIVSDWGFQYIQSTEVRIGWAFVNDNFGLTTKKYEILLAEGEFDTKTDFDSVASTQIFEAVTGNEFANYVIKNLSPSTKYSLGIKSVDQFGNRSELSEVFVFTTFEVTDLEWTNEEEAELELDVSNYNNPTTSISIVNHSSKLTQLQYVLNDYENDDKLLPLSNQRSFSTVLPFTSSGSLTLKPFRSTYVSTEPTNEEKELTLLPSSKIIDSVYHELGALPHEMVGYDGVSSEYANKFVAERDIEIGMVKAFLSSEMYESVPYSASIFIGGENQPSGRALSTVNFYVTDKKDGGWVEIYFKSPIKVNAGETFWISIAAPQGIFSPIGADDNLSWLNSGKSFSRATDQIHKEYTDLTKLMRVLLKIRAYEITEKAELISFSKSIHTISNGEEAKTDIVLTNSKKWKNGRYKLQVLGVHDEPSKSPLVKNVFVNVTGNTPALTYDIDEVYFGTLFENQSQNQKIYIKNEGNASSEPFNINISEEEYFEVYPNEVPSIEPGSRFEVTVSAKATDEVIEVEDEITFTNSSKKIPLKVNRKIGPKIISSINTIQFLGDSAFNITETRVAEFSLTNTGDEPTLVVFESIEERGYTSFVKNIIPSRAYINVGDTVSFIANINPHGLIIKSPYQSVTLYANHSVESTPIHFEIELLGLDKPIPIYDSIVDFGEAYYNEDLLLTTSFRIQNGSNMPGDFELIDISEGFSFGNSYPPSRLWPNSMFDFSLIATPETTGDLEGSFSFKLGDDIYEVKLQVKVTPHPTISVDSSSLIKSNEFVYGEIPEDKSTIMVKNESEDVDLIYSSKKPSWLREENEIINDSEGSDGYGYEYTLLDTLIWEDIKDIGYNINHELFPPEFAYQYKLEGFKIPFYGHYYDRFIVTSDALISFNQEKNIEDFFYTQPPIGYDIDKMSFPNERDHGIISAFLLKTAPSGLDDSGIYIYEHDDRVIIQFEKMLAYLSGSVGLSTLTTLQMVLYKNGDIDIAYKTLPDDFVDQWIGMKNIEGNHAWQYLDHSSLYLDIILGKILRIKAPKLHSLPPLSSKEITLEYFDSNTPVGEHYQDLIVHSNDLQNPGVATKMSLKINGEADLSIKEESLIFDQVPYLEDSVTSQSLTFHLINEGSLPVFTTGKLRHNTTFDFKLDTLLGAFTELSIPISYNVHSPHEVTDTLDLFFDNGEMLSLPLEGNAKLPAVMNYNLGTTSRNDTLDILVNQGQAPVHVIELSNIGEEQVLDYNLTLGIAKYGWGVDKTNNILPMSKAKSNEESKESIVINHNTFETFSMMQSYDFNTSKGGNISTNTFEKMNNEISITSFSDSISYDFPTNEPMRLLGRPNSEIQYAGKFEVDSPQGFTLTHIKNFFLKQSESEWKFEVIRGDTPSSNDVITSQAYVPTSLLGDMELIKLDKPLFFEQGETFVIKVITPEDVHYSLPVDLGVPSVLGKYFITINGGELWEEMSDSFYYTYAIKLRAMDAYGQEWVDISPRTGQINSTESDSITITTKMDNFETGSYEGYLYIDTNESLNKKTILPVAITYNAAPICKDSTHMILSEGDSVTWQIAIYDAENQKLSVSDTSNMEFFEYDMKNDSLSLKMMPSYTMSGDYFPSIEIKDELGAKTKIDFSIHVIDKKVAPIVVQPFDTLEVYTGSENILDLEGYFETLDGEKLSYYVKGLDETTIAWVNGSLLTISSVGEKSQKISIVAENESGLNVESELTVSIIEEPLSINGNLMNQKVYPNPTASNIFVKLPNSLINTSFNIEVMTILGKQLLSKEVKTDKPMIEVDLSTIPKGLYILNLNNENGNKISYKVIKE